MKDKQKLPGISAVQDFWSKNPMTFSVWKGLSPDELLKQVVAKVRKKAWHAQEKDEPLYSNHIDYASLKDKKVLEIGYGTGWLSKEFISAGAIYTGIDLSTFHYDLCNLLFNREQNATFTLGNAENLPFEDNTFDYVVSYGVLHHSTDTKKCIDEALRVLKVECTLFVMIYRKSFLKYWYNKFFKFGVLRGEILRYKSVHRVVERHTDAHSEDGISAPISRHYKVSDIPLLFSKFSSYKYQIYGSYGELNGFPSTRFNIGQFMSVEMKQRLLKKYGGYLFIWGRK